MLCFVHYVVEPLVAEPEPPSMLGSHGADNLLSPFSDAWRVGDPHWLMHRPSLMLSEGSY